MAWEFIIRPWWKLLSSHGNFTWERVAYCYLFILPPTCCQFNISSPGLAGRDQLCFWLACTTPPSAGSYRGDPGGTICPPRMLLRWKVVPFWFGQTVYENSSFLIFLKWAVILKNYYFSTLLRYNWCITLFKFKVCNVLTWHPYILPSDYHWFPY